MRYPGIDVVSGVMIVWMVVYHVFQVAQHQDSILYEQGLRWLFFFVAWFYFKSGYLHPVARRQPWRTLVPRLARKLLVPLVLWGGVGLVVWIPEQILLEHETPKRLATHLVRSFIVPGDVPSNQPLWFFLSFFFVKIASTAILESRRSFLYCAILVVGGNLLLARHPILPLGLHSLPSGVCFYCAGAWFRVLRDRGGWGRFAMPAGVLLFVGLNLGFASYVDIHYNHLQYGSRPWFHGMSILACALAVSVPGMLRWRPLAWCGEHSMAVFSAHWPVLCLAKDVLDLAGPATPGPWRAVLLAVATIPTVLTGIVVAGRLRRPPPRRDPDQGIRNPE